MFLLSSQQRNVPEQPNTIKSVQAMSAPSIRSATRSGEQCVDM